MHPFNFASNRISMNNEIAILEGKRPLVCIRTWVIHAAFNEFLSLFTYLDSELLYVLFQRPNCSIDHKYKYITNYSFLTLLYNSED